MLIYISRKRFRIPYVLWPILAGLFITSVQNNSQQSSWSNCYTRVTSVVVFIPINAACYRGRRLARPAAHRSCCGASNRRTAHSSSSAVNECEWVMGVGSAQRETHFRSANTRSPDPSPQPTAKFFIWLMASR